MQVEGLCSMVSGVEELVAKAERHCTAMQVYFCFPAQLWPIMPFMLSLHRTHSLQFLQAS